MYCTERAHLLYSNKEYCPRSDLCLPTANYTWNAGLAFSISIVCLLFAALNMAYTWCYDNHAVSPVSKLQLPVSSIQFSGPKWSVRNINAPRRLMIYLMRNLCQRLADESWEKCYKHYDDSTSRLLFLLLLLLYPRVECFVWHPWK